MSRKTSNFLESIALIRTLPCLGYPGKIIVVGRPSSPLADVLPYLAALPGVISFHPEARSLTFRRQTGLITLFIFLRSSLPLLRMPGGFLHSLPAGGP